MLLILVVFALLGAALWGLVSHIAPPRADLAAAVGQLDARRARAQLAQQATHESAAGRRAHFGRWLRVSLESRGVRFGSLRNDLELLDETVEEFLVQKFSSAAAGFVMPSVVTTMAVAVGIGVPVPATMTLAVVLAVGGFFLPDTLVASRARARRKELRAALAVYLDLLSMSMAAGVAAPQALPSTAAIGRGWGFGLLSETIEKARYAGTSPWAALEELGERTGIGELRDLGVAISHAAERGAKVRETLQVRATTLRRKQLAEAHEAAEKGDQSLAIANAILGFGMVLFLGFPAVAVMTSF